MFISIIIHIIVEVHFYLLYIIIYIIFKSVYSDYILNINDYILYYLYTLEDLKFDEFNKLKLYTTIEPDTKNVKLFIIINLFGNFLFSKSDLFINNNDVEHK